MKNFIKLRNIIAVIVCSLIVRNVCSAQSQTTSDSVSAFMRHQMQVRQVPGLQLAVIQHGKIIKLESFGVANLEDSVTVNNSTIFSINSITKAFTGVAIMQLVEAGKIDVGAPISKYLDTLPALWQHITVRQLLTHVSGIPDAIDPANDNWAFKAVGDSGWKKITEMPMDFTPGEQFAYNQTNYVLLGMIIDKLSGTSFLENFRKQQFAIAQMTHTDFGDFYDVIAHKSRSYRSINNLFRNNFENFPMPTRTAAGINSTAEDMVKWIVALQNGKLLREKSSLQALWTPAHLNNGRIAGFSTLLNGYGLGWTIMSRAEHPGVGAIGGGRSAFFIYPDDDLAIVVLTNKLRSGPEYLMDEIASYYVPSMKLSTGFSLPADIKALRMALGKQGFDKLEKVLITLEHRKPGFKVSERDLNTYGYFTLEYGKVKDAIEIFKLNTHRHPGSGNAFDSLAEGYMTAGEKALAIRNYRLSLALEPGNLNAVNQLSILEKVN